MKRLWDRWVSIWDGTEAPLILAILRIDVSLAILWDFLTMWYLGLVVPLLAAEEAGGLQNVTGWSNPPHIYTLLPATEGTAWLLWGTIVVAASMSALGLFTRPAMITLLLAYAQTALINSMGDRGIDLMLRNVLLILIFSRCSDTLSLDALRRTGRVTGDGQPVPAWPRRLLILQLVVMYFMAGVAKTALPWTPLGGYSALYLLLQDPAVARFDWSILAPIYPLTQAATAVTMVWEYGTPLLAIWFLLRGSDEPPKSRLGQRFVQLPIRALWMTVGVTFHLLIASSLQLGIFPWAMLGLYPAFFHPDELRARLGLAVPRPEPNPETAP